MIKKEYIKKTIWFIIIIVNIIFFMNLYLDINLKAQRLVFQINNKIITDKRINNLSNKYLFSDNDIEFKNLIIGRKISIIYSKDLNKVFAFKRYICQSNKDVFEYSRTDENIHYPADNESLHTLNIPIPIFSIIKTYFNDDNTFKMIIKIDDTSLPITVNYVNYKHMCETYEDWSVSFS